MKKQLLFACLTTALLTGCSTTEWDPTEVKQTHIVAKAQGKGEISVETRGPVTGISFNNKTADVYTTTESLYQPTDRTTMFTNAYARGTITFNGNNYMGYNAKDFGGAGGGNKLLPQDGTELYMYGFYPAGWTRKTNATHESLTYSFDGHHDVMSSWFERGDDIIVKFNDPTNRPDKADFIFKHLLTRYNVRIKANEADAVSAWGKVKSIKIKESAVKNRVTFSKPDDSVLIVGYDNDGTATTPSFFKLKGTTNAPEYTDDKFEAADYDNSLDIPLSTYANACYTMVAPTTVDDTEAPELTLLVTTVTQVNGTSKETLTEIPVTLEKSKFTNNDNTTRGYSISVGINFRASSIQASAIVEEWRDYGVMYEDVRLPSRAKIGEARDGGVVYWVDATDPTKYKVVALEDEGNVYPLAAGFSSTSSELDGRVNMQEMKDFAKAQNIDFKTNFKHDALCMAKGNNWHIPAKYELEELYKAITGADKTIIEQAILKRGGNTFETSYYWTNTIAAGRPWAISFADGTGQSQYAGNYGRARCIKSDIPASKPSISIGTITDGGVIYWINPIDNTDYKVMSLDESIEVFAPLGLGTPTRSRQTGLLNMDLMKITAIDRSSSLATAFPAANFCDAKGSGWYLPAVMEFVELSEAYIANKVSIDATLAVSGTPISSDFYYTSSSFISGTDEMVSIFKIAITEGQEELNPGETHKVRCIRRSAPSAPKSATLGEVQGSAMVYYVNPADATDYRLVTRYHVQRKIANNQNWSLGADGRDENDGRKNVAAMVAFSNAHTDGATGVLAEDFPAAAWCKSRGEGWYLPAKNEVQALYDGNSLNEILFLDAFSDGAHKITDTSIYTGTEYSSDITKVQTLSFKMGTWGPYDKDQPYYGYIRCIKRSK